MPRILFVPLPAPGHILPTLGVARYVMSKGCETVYLTAPRFRQLVDSAGAYSETMLPTDGRHNELVGQHLWDEFVPGTGRHAWGDRLGKLIRILLTEQHFDLVLLDRHLGTGCCCDIAEIPFGGRCVLFATSLPKWKELEQDTLKTPTLIFCPEELEVPKFRYPCPGLHYVEPSLRPMDEDLLLNGEIDPDRPLVLAVFGNHTIRYPAFWEQCKLIAELALRQPKLQFLLAVGSAKMASMGNLPTLPNLTIADRLPQRRLLESTSAFVTHGGLGSIKEAIIAGVPMVVLPFLYDQPFNAMRVRYHNLGEAIFPQQRRIELLEAAVLRAVSGSYDTVVRSMQKTFVTIESAKPSFAYIDGYL
jgi:UDP:flavonoid glycosyltransferase YjiC (YdhE family)